MQIRTSTIKNLSLAAVILVAGIVGIVLMTNVSGNSPTSKTVSQDASGRQIIDLTAKSGYSPMLIEAKSNTESVLRITTKSTFDCSTALRIPQLNVAMNLPANGATEIPIPAQQSGTSIKGTCSMGMYNFQINFV